MKLTELSLSHVGKKIRIRGVEGFLQIINVRRFGTDNKAYIKGELVLFLDRYDEFSDTVKFPVAEWHDWELLDE